MTWILTLLLSQALAADPPFGLKESGQALSVGAINENIRSLSDSERATQNDLDTLEAGYKTDLLDDNNTWTGTNVFSGATTTSGAATLTSSVTFQGGVRGPMVAGAWVTFVGTGTVVILDSVNVTSMTDIGTGNYRVNFTTPFANNYYSAFMATERSSSLNANAHCQVDPNRSPTSGHFDILCVVADAYGVEDQGRVRAVFFGR